MDYQVVEKIHIRKDKCEKVGAFLYDRELDALYHESPWPFPVQIGISDGLSKCQVTPMFLKLPFLLKGWVQEYILLREIELLKLALNGKILMHGSCYVEDGKGVLVIGFSNSGKTYQTYKSVAEGARLVSEEYTILSEGQFSDKGMWQAEPYNKLMKTCFSAKTMKVANIQMNWKEKIWLFFATIRAKFFPFMYEAVIWKTIPVNGSSAYIDKIVYGSTGREIKDWRQFAILCENEFPFMSSEFLQAYAIASGLDLLAIQETQRGLIRDFVKSIYPNNGK